MIVKSSLAFVVAVLLAAGMAATHRRRPSGARALLLLASACFVVATLTHVFEALHLVPAAGWGKPDSVGHYIDLTAALVGVILVVAAASLALARHSAK